VEPVPASQEHAALAIIRLANQFPGELVLVTLGPLTNLAIACSLDPTLPSKVKGLTWMGGSPYGNGNSTPVAGMQRRDPVRMISHCRLIHVAHDVSCAMQSSTYSLTQRRRMLC
jgi:hypothetical protein